MLCASDRNQTYRLEGVIHKKAKFCFLSNEKTGAVLRFAYLDSVQSQTALDKACNTKMTNSIVSRHIGSIGRNEGLPTRTSCA